MRVRTCEMSERVRDIRVRPYLFNVVTSVRVYRVRVWEIRILICAYHICVRDIRVRLQNFTISLKIKLLVPARKQSYSYL